MVRAFAASAGILRAGQSPIRFAEAPGLPGSLVNSVLDRIVVGLVLIFLGLAAFAVALQFASTRREQLETSESGLAVAAHFVAAEIGRKALQGEELLDDLPQMPWQVYQHQPGRRFILIDIANTIRGGNVLLGEVGKPAAMLFADKNAFAMLWREQLVHRAELPNGDLASAVVLHPAGYSGTLLAIQPVQDGLRPWRQHALIIGGLLMCFGAITIAFTLVFCAQRERTLHAGSKIRQMRSQFEIALEHGRCGLWDWSINAPTLQFSTSMLRMLGLNGDGPLDKRRIEAMLHPEDHDLFDRIAAGAAAGDSEFECLFRIRRSENAYVWLRMRAVVCDDGRGSEAPRLLGVVMDVTRERLAEEESHRADIRLRDAIDSISEAFVLWDDNNRLVMCNSNYRAFHGLSADSVRRGTPYTAVMEEASEPRILIEIDRGTDSDGRARAYEAQLQDGRWLLISERHTKDGGYVSVGTDITARKTQEERLIENERQLRLTVTDLGNSREALRLQASQLAELADRYLEQKAEAIGANRAKAEFLANMNHEIRTPLNHIIGFAEMIESEIFGPCGSERYLDYARDIRKSGISLTALISDILDMARIEAGRVALERAPIALGALLERARNTVSDAAEAKNMIIEIEPDSSEAAGQRMVHVDANAISQALAHLLRNAIRFAPSAGRILVRARMSGAHINIFVADAGCTLSTGELGSMIDPFGHVDGMLQDGCKGSGLGLSIARSLIELHGGTMRMRSAPQLGSLTMVHLPIMLQPVQLDLPM